MLFLLNGTLPWMKVKVDKISDAHKVLLMKKKISVGDFMNVQTPKIFFEVLNELRVMDCYAKFDYLKLKYKFLDLINKNGFQNDFKFDWCLQNN